MVAPTYLQRFCAPEIFEPNHDSIKLSEGMLSIKDEVQKLIEDMGPKYTARSTTRIVDQTMRIVDDVIGRPKLVAEWTGRYFDTWNRVIVEEVRGDLIAGKLFVDLIYKPVTKKYLSVLATVLDKGHLDTLSTQLLSPWTTSLCYWHTVGRKEYIISRGLAQKLKQTELRGYPIGNLHLPYDSIYIDMQNYGAFGKEESIEGCLAFNIGNLIAIGLVLADTYESREAFPRLIHIEKEDTSVEKAVENSLENYKKANYGDAVEFYKKPWKELLSYIMNVVLYATMPDVEQTFQHYDPNYVRLQKKLKKQRSPKKKEKIRQQLKNTTAAGYTYLGGSITVNRVAEQSESQGSKGGRKLHVRTLVSGHWRDQPYGKLRLERKRIWIEPFWRGPDGAAITQKRHHLQ